MNDKEIIRIEGIDPQLKKMVKIQSAIEEKTMREYIIEALEEKLKRPSK